MRIALLLEFHLSSTIRLIIELQIQMIVILIIFQPSSFSPRQECFYQSGWLTIIIKQRVALYATFFHSRNSASGRSFSISSSFAKSTSKSYTANSTPDFQFQIAKNISDTEEPSSKTLGFFGSHLRLGGRDSESHTEKVRLSILLPYLVCLLL